MSALTLNGNDFPVRRDGFAWSLERTQDKGRAVNGALRVAVMGTPRRVIEARSIPLPWATAQSWLALDGQVVAVGGSYISTSAWCEVEVRPVAMGLGEVLVRLEEV